MANKEERGCCETVTENMAGLPTGAQLVQVLPVSYSRRVGVLSAGSHNRGRGTVILHRHRHVFDMLSVRVGLVGCKQLNHLRGYASGELWYHACRNNHPLREALNRR